MNNVLTVGQLKAALSNVSDNTTIASINLVLGQPIVQTGWEADFTDGLNVLCTKEASNPEMCKALIRQEIGPKFGYFRFYKVFSNGHKERVWEM